MARRDFGTPACATPETAIIPGYACHCQMPTPTNREVELIEAWLVGLGLTRHHLAPLRGDVSSRRYYRARRNRQSVIVAYYPRRLRDACGRFRIANELLQQQGVRVPEIHAIDCSRGLMLLEDLGSRTLFDLHLVTDSNLDDLLKQAIGIVENIAAIPPEPVAKLNPELDLDVFRAEIEKTWTLFLRPRGLCGSARQEQALEEAIDSICRRIADAPRRPCHRDFMARNLVPVDGHRALAVIDHQDLRLGPPAYDLACLFNDSLYPHQQLVDQLLNESAAAGGIDRDLYRRCVVQRTLKIVGTFVSFARQGSKRYLNLVAPSLEACLGHLELLPEGEPLVGDLRRLWQPALHGGTF